MRQWLRRSAPGIAPRICKSAGSEKKSQHAKPRMRLSLSSQATLHCSADEITPLKAAVHLVDGRSRAGIGSSTLFSFGPESSVVLAENQFCLGDITSPVVRKTMDDFVAQRPQPLAIGQLRFAFALHQFVAGSELRI